MKNPKWTRDELILALDLYVELANRNIDSGNPKIIELSNILNRLPEAEEKRVNEKFRNPKGVAMKLSNFRRFDPNHTGKGLERGGKLEEVIWNEFFGHNDRLRNAAQAIKATAAPRPYILQADDAADNIAAEDRGDYLNNGRDERDIVNRQIKARRGQASFRNSLFDRYGEVCMVTGCTIKHLLEAAHINPYRGENDNHPNNGLILRSDIHTLFDLNLLKIEPQALTIHMNEEVRQQGYEVLHGSRLRACTATRRPDAEALRARWGNGS